MKQLLKELIFNTNKKRDLINITTSIEEFVLQSDIQNGLCIVFVLHATAALIINEDETRLKQDFLDNIEKILPFNASYKHNIYDNNAAAHIASSFLNQNCTLIIKERKLQRGTWQDIFLVELDGPRKNRRVLIKIIGE